MQNMTRRLEKLEQEIGVTQPAGRLTLVSWVPALGSTPNRAVQGDTVLHRLDNETETAFLARVRTAFKPATGFRTAFLHHDAP